MSRLVLIGSAVLEERIMEDAAIVMDGNQIIEIGTRSEVKLLADDEIAAVEQGWIIPGLIDIHVHGSQGADVMDGSVEAIEQISQSLAAYGVTGFLATTMTDSMDNIRQAVKAVLAAKDQGLSGAVVLGVHLEGPWINRKYKGAQPEGAISVPSKEELLEMLALLRDDWKMVTLAPEINGGLDAIKLLAEKGVICSIGHTDATYNQVMEAIEQGASHGTHLFNAMRGLHHREPGTVGAILADSRLTCDLIADTIHVHPAAIKVVWDAKGRDKCMLISDGMSAVGMPEGEYELGGQRVLVRGCTAMLADGTLAGSRLTLNRAVETLVQHGGVDLTDAVYMASRGPAIKLGFSQKGSIRQGFDADLAVLNSNYSVDLTIVQGKVCYRRS